MKVPNSMKWASGQPDNRGEGEFCTEPVLRRGLNDIPCNYETINRIVCQYNRNCPSGFEMANGISGKCFIIKWADGYKEAKKAKEFCEARYIFCSRLTQILRSSNL